MVSFFVYDNVVQAVALSYKTYNSRKNNSGYLTKVQQNFYRIDASERLFLYTMNYCIYQQNQS